MSDEERRTPVQGDTGWHMPRRYPKAKPPGSIAWSEHIEAWCAYNVKYRNHQDAERIAERGGFSYGELVQFLKREPTTWKAT